MSVASNPSEVKLVSADGVEFVVPREVITVSKTINAILENLSHNDVFPHPITLENIHSTHLQKVLDWCHHIHSNPQELHEDPPPGRVMELSEWDKEYLRMDHTCHYHTIMATLYLDIPPLMNFLCEGVARLIRGKSPAAIRREFGITEEFTEEQEEQLRRENNWKQW